MKNLREMTAEPLRMVYLAKTPIFFEIIIIIC
jgi:hypothetical protein